MHLPARNAPHIMQTTLSEHLPIAIDIISDIAKLFLDR